MLIYSFMGWVYVKEMFILIMLTFFVGKMFSFLHDRDFRCFYPCGINLSHIPVPARGKDKKRTVVRQSHGSCTSFHDATVLLK